MNNKTSQFISWVFHPLLMPFYAMWLLLLFQGISIEMIPLKLKLMLTGMVFISASLIPLGLIFVLYKLGLINSMYMNTREERLFPLLVIAIFYYLTYYLLKGIPIPLIFHMYMLGATFLIIVLMAVNFFRKVSLHAAGMGAVTGLVAGTAFHDGANLAPVMIVCLLISGLVASARIKLNAHQPADVYLGWLTGAVIMFLTGYFF
jgi:hypothetical protein